MKIATFSHGGQRRVGAVDADGELRQDASTKDLIFDLPTLIETCSREITLHPGDVIATRTPSSVGVGMKPPRYLAAGDTVRMLIDGLSLIQNRVAEAQS